MPRTTIALTLVAAALCLAAAVLQTDEAHESVSKPPASRPAACALEVAKKAAFRFHSMVKAKGSKEGDRFSATLSWQVVEQAEDSWLLHVGLTDVSLTQRLSLPDERVDQSLDAPFAVRIDRQCRFVELGFSSRWRPRTRQLVASLLRSFEFVWAADGAPRWTVKQQDGLGIYEANYRGQEDRTVVRKKVAYRPHPMAKTFGVRVHIYGARATARLSDDGHWLAEASGREQVQLTVGGAAPVALSQEFSLQRDDSAFWPAPSVVSALDWRDPYELPVQAPSPAPKSAPSNVIPYGDAVVRFAQLRGQGPASSYAASRLLADHLRARPGDALRLVEDVRAGKLDPSGRPTPRCAWRSSALCAHRGHRALTRSRRRSGCWRTRRRLGFVERWSRGSAMRRRRPRLGRCWSPTSRLSATSAFFS